MRSYLNCPECSSRRSPTEGRDFPITVGNIPYAAFLFFFIVALHRPSACVRTWAAERAAIVLNRLTKRYGSQLIGERAQCRHNRPRRHGPPSRSIFGFDAVTLQILVGANRPVLVVPAEDENQRGDALAPIMVCIGTGS